MQSPKPESLNPRIQASWLQVGSFVVSPDPSQDPRQGFTPSPRPATTTCVSAKAAQAGLFPNPLCAMPPAVRSTRQTGCLLSPLRGGTFCIGYCTLARYPAPPPFPGGWFSLFFGYLVAQWSMSRSLCCFSAFGQDAFPGPRGRSQGCLVESSRHRRERRKRTGASTALGSGYEWPVRSPFCLRWKGLQHFSNATHVPIAATAGKSEEHVLDAPRASSGQSRRPTSARTVAMVDRRTPSPLPVSCCHGNVATLTPRLREAKRFNFPFTGFHGAPAGCGFAMLYACKFFSCAARPCQPAEKNP